MVTPFSLGDLLTLRKIHPCGGSEWRIERVGADIGIRCLNCNHYLLRPRRRLERMLKQRTPASSKVPPTPAPESKASSAP